MATTAERLTNVQDAIDALISKRVASYTVGEHSHTYLELDSLRDLERELLARAAREDATTGCSGIQSQTPRLGW